MTQSRPYYCIFICQLDGTLLGKGEPTTNRALLDALVAESREVNSFHIYDVVKVPAEDIRPEHLTPATYSEQPAKDKVGTNVKFTVYTDKFGDCVYTLLPGQLGQKVALRVARDDMDPTKWRIDRLGTLGRIWEAVESTKFDSAKAAARRLVARLTT